MTTAIIGTGNLGGALARHLVAGGEAVVLAARSDAGPQALAGELGPLAHAASVKDAMTAGETVVLALWLDATRELLAQHARLLEGKVVIDPSNPIGFDDDGRMIRTLPDGQSAGSIVAALLPAGAYYVKAFGTLGADSLATSAHREPRVALFFATDESAAATEIERLIRVAGFEPVQVGGVAQASRLEGPDGPLSQGGLNGALLDLDQARTVLAKGVPA
ncbi:MAG TPA: NAD(P)-binding domain-containing protein [Gaiellaceae bacterium]|jgi:hypothetical protein|nr:NAD(P)-binding domain-containing protein [Gaiellaceae bacterium]